MVTAKTCRSDSRFSPCRKSMNDLIVTVIPGLANSPTIRGEPRVGCMGDIVPYISLTSAEIGGRPGLREPDGFRQYPLNRLRCQQMTVSDFTKIGSLVHPVKAVVTAGIPNWFIWTTSAVGLPSNSAPRSDVHASLPGLPSA